ncbi:MAG: RpiB/LacA/LacB family sugar-phosphate isomerase [Bdellovibrionaceae bacterium]|nr:RpiB/LacA/LacB family sugar-phosphate isomerase [Pseudobdellovibrionaceae bacterium]
MSTSSIFISSDHAGVKLKTFLLENLKFHSLINLGPDTEDSVDYPDFADLVCKKIQDHNKDNPNLTKGILICGSGQGMVMRANRYPFIRAGLCHNSYSAQLVREHNNANVLCLAARPTLEKENAEFIKNPATVNNRLFANALKIVESFLSTEFKHGRHSARVRKLQ